MPTPANLPRTCLALSGPIEWGLEVPGILAT
jgi:hypothetical protein